MHVGWQQWAAWSALSPWASARAAVTTAAAAAATAGGGKTLTIYSSMPLQGASSPQTKAIVNGMKLALEQAGSKAGEHTIKFVSLDNSTAQAGTWTPEATPANARKAAQDDTTAVYLGEFNSGAAAVSIPLLNEAGVPRSARRTPPSA